MKKPTDTNQATDDTQKASTGTLSVQHAQHGTATGPIIPDTNQASLFELCKKVYELTGWEAPETYKAEDGNPENDWQAYDTDYLLEKLPKSIDGRQLNGWYEDDCTTYGYGWDVTVWHEEADTPLNALLKLVIVLDDAGQLKGER